MKRPLCRLLVILLIVIILGSLFGCVEKQKPEDIEPVASETGTPIGEFLKGTAFDKVDADHVISVRYTDDTTAYETDDEQQISVFLKDISEVSIGDKETDGEDIEEAYTLEFTFDDGDKYTLSFPSYKCYAADDGAIYQITDPREPRHISEYAHSMRNRKLVDEALATEIGIGMTEIDICSDGLRGNYDIELNGDGKEDSLQFKYAGTGDEAAPGWYIEYELSGKESEWLTYFRCPPEESERSNYGRLFSVPDENGGSILVLARPTDRQTEIITFELSGLSHSFSFSEALPVSFENGAFTFSDGETVAIQDLVP